MSYAESPLLEVRGVTKRFPGVLALRGVSLKVGRGEVLAVIGENGAGKSTLMKIMAGVQAPDAGELLVDGQPVSIDSVKKAAELGVALIHQELNLCPGLDVGANIFLGREPKVAAAFVNRKQIESGARQYLARVGLDISPKTPVRRLSIGQQQLVEIAKALSADARVLIMDEPTSSLSTSEANRLFDVICDLRSKGAGIVYISHRLGEVKLLADRVTVLRDGANAGDIPKDQIDHDSMVRLMVGRDIAQFYARSPHAPGDVALEARAVRTPAWPHHPVSFAVRAGEIVGLAGLVGAGRTELLRVLFGADPNMGGEIRVAGRPIGLDSPLDAIRAGLALAPEDRKEQGLVLAMNVRENLSLPRLRRDQRFGLLNRSSERLLADEMIRRLRVKTPSPSQIVQFLSGGNQQKVVFGKWLAMRPKVLLLDEPTRGVDIGAKQEIYRLMEDLAGEGVAILFASSEMEEILGMSDRTLVMHEGRLMGELAREQLSEQAVMRLATGRAS